MHRVAVFLRPILVAVVACSATCLACSRGDGGDAASASAQTVASSPGKSRNDSTKKSPNAGAPTTGRPSPSVTLATSDVAVIAQATIEDGTALTGDLRPIETMDVRSRIEGDLRQVLVREGQQVSAGQVLARFDDSEQEIGKKSAEADRAAAKSDVANAEWTYEQDQQLFKAGAIAQRDFRNAEQAVAAARARLAATDARLRSTANQSRDTRVFAPAAGVIDKRMVQGSEHVARGAPLFTIVRNGTLELAAAVPARQAGAVRVGQLVHFVADGRRIDGHVARLSPTVDPATRAITVYVEIPNPGGTIRGGTFATGRVVSRTLTDVVAVPVTALKQAADNGKPFVYRIDGKTLNIANVQLGPVDERLGLAQVLEGLQAGDRVVVGNVGTLGRGMQVTIAGEEKSGKRTR